MALLDQHFTVFCRERKSYEYCLASNKRASFILADDMAFGLELESFSAFDKKKALKVASSMSDADLIFLLVVIWAKYQQTLSRLQRQLIANTIIKNGLRLGFFLRTDEEKATDSSVKNTVDVAGFAGSSCADPGITRLLSGMFYGAINTVDIVVTDRLHVGIMSAILGKQVFLIDNSYGKLSGVYHNSMTGMPNVRFVQSVSSLRVSSLPTMRPTADLSFLASGKPDLSDFVRAYFSRAKIDNPLNNSMWR
jgi:exopolysaccharide biosynthesis predicted pyruvyltransferase EpsI